MWAESSVWRIAGRLVQLRANSPAAFARAEALLPHARIPITVDAALDDAEEPLDTVISVLHGGVARDGRTPFHVIYLNHKRIAREPNFETALMLLQSALNSRIARFSSSASTWS